MDIYNFEKIKPLVEEPEDPRQYEEWILQKEIPHFLNDEANDEYLIVYASLPHVFIHAVFVPALEVDEETVQDLLNWSCNPFSSWGVTCSSEDAWIGSPLDGSGSKTIASGEQLLFGRSFDGDKYFEFNQKIAHVLDVHFVQERKSWCKLNDYGDIDEVIKIVEIDLFRGNETGTIICIKQSSLGEYAGAEDLVLVRMFYFMRYRSKEFADWGNDRSRSDISGFKSIYGSLTIVPETGSFSRGVQILDVRTSKRKIANAIWGRDSDKDSRQYCTYIAHDWKKGRTAEISCSPDCLASYFAKQSGLPYEMTPAFFRPEVLLKYKNDRRKYRLKHRSVSCRGAWDLVTFDVNSAGQVHTYLCYLGQLPYEEQIHWKQYNEHPKAPISERALATDFKGKFYDGYDALESLKRKLSDLHAENVNWWKLRNKDALDHVHCPYTHSKDEWAEELLNLDQLLIEGFEEAWLRKKARELGCDPDDRLRSLKLISVILVTDGFEEDHAKKIMSPFHTVHDLRMIKGHTSGSNAETERRNAISEFGSYKRHFEKLCKDCDESLEIVKNAMGRIQ